MRPTELASAIAALIPTRQPIFLWGPPGVGKSSLVRQACKSLDLLLVDIRAVLLDPVDLRGLPSIRDGKAIWCPPGFLPENGKGVLFFDELAQAPPLVQASLLQLTLDRQLGEYRLPDEWTVIAASNRMEDRAGTHRLITPLLNRFLHLDLEVSHADWMKWAAAAGIREEVRAFLHFRPHLLFAFDPTAGARAFPTPRSWQFVSDVLPATPPELMHPIVAGCVGDGASAEFQGFLSIYRDLPDPDEVLATAETHRIPSSPDILWALVGALTERCRGADATLLGQFITYIRRVSSSRQRDFAVKAFRDAAAVNKRTVEAPGASAFMAEHKGELDFRLAS